MSNHLPLIDKYMFDDVREVNLRQVLLRVFKVVNPPADAVCAAIEKRPPRRQRFISPIRLRTSLREILRKQGPAKNCRLFPCRWYSLHYMSTRGVVVYERFVGGMWGVHSPAPATSSRASSARTCPAAATQTASVSGQGSGSG